MTGTSTIISSDYGNISAIFNRAYTYTIDSAAANDSVNLTVPAGLTILGVIGPVTVSSITQTDGGNTTVAVATKVTGVCVVNIIVAPMEATEGHVDPRGAPAEAASGSGSESGSGTGQ